MQCNFIKSRVPGKRACRCREAQEACGTSQPHGHPGAPVAAAASPQGARWTSEQDQGACSVQSPGPRPSVPGYNGVQNNWKTSSCGITEPAPLGGSWPKKHSGRAGRVGQFRPSDTRASPAACGPAGPAFTQGSPLPPSSGVQLPVRSAGSPWSRLCPGSSGELSGWSFSTRSTADSGSGRRPTGQWRVRGRVWECQPAALHPQGRKTEPLGHLLWPKPGLGSCFQKQGQCPYISQKDCVHTPICSPGRIPHRHSGPCKSAGVCSREQGAPFLFLSGWNPSGTVSWKGLNVSGSHSCQNLEAIKTSFSK